MTLHLYSTRYARGAVVKLAESLTDPDPAAKFVVQRHEGGFILKRAEGRKLAHVCEFLTESAAIEIAERECERIRLSLGGARARN